MPRSYAFLLRELNLLDGPREIDFDNVTDLATSVVNAPTALVSIIDNDASRQFFRGETGLSQPWKDRRETPLTHSFCQHVAADDTMLIVGDARLHERVRENLAVRDLSVIAYLGVPIHGADGRAVGALCVIDDQPRDWSEREVDLMTRLGLCVDQLIRLRVERRLSALLLEEQQHFNAALSHDLKAPLRHIKIALEMMRDGDQPSGTLNPQEIADTAITSAWDLVTAVLEYSQAGRRECDIRGLDLDRLVLAVLDELRPEIDASDAHVAVGALGRVEGVEWQIRRLLSNLIENAIKYRHPDRKPHVSVEAARAEDRLTLTVRDNASGMSREQVETIFRPFSRLAHPLMATGHGLGLSICARVALNHGGRIDVASEPDAGSTFTVQLPLKQQILHPKDAEPGRTVEEAPTK